MDAPLLADQTVVTIASATVLGLVAAGLGTAWYLRRRARAAQAAAAPHCALCRSTNINTVADQYRCRVCGFHSAMAQDERVIPLLEEHAVLIEARDALRKAWEALQTSKRKRRKRASLFECAAEEVKRATALVETMPSYAAQFPDRPELNPENLEQTETNLSPYSRHLEFLVEKLSKRIRAGGFQDDA